MTTFILVTTTKQKFKKVPKHDSVDCISNQSINMSN